MIQKNARYLVSVILLASANAFALDPNLSSILTNRDVIVGSTEIKVVNNTNHYNVNLTGSDRVIEYAKEKGQYRIEAHFDSTGKINRVTEVAALKDGNVPDYRLVTAYINNGKDLFSVTSCGGNYYKNEKAFDQIAGGGCYTVTPASCQRILEKAQKVDVNEKKLDACRDVQSVGAEIMGWDDKFTKGNPEFVKIQEANLTAIKATLANTFPGVLTPDMSLLGLVDAQARANKKNIGIKIKDSKYLDQASSLNFSLHLRDIGEILALCNQTRAFVVPVTQPIGTDSKPWRADKAQ